MPEQRDDRLDAIAGDGNRVACGEVLWTIERGEYPSWHLIPLRVIAVNPIDNLVVFTSPKNPDYLETFPAALLTHRSPTTLEALKERACELLCCEHDSDDMTVPARELQALVETAYALGAEGN